LVKINKKVEYALIVLKHMSTKDIKSLSQAREVCELYQTPFDTTAKVMQQMNQAGFFNSQKGAKGGYSLKVDLNNISYLQLVEIIEGKKSVIDCADTKCNLIKSCNIVSPITKLNKHLTYFFQGLSLEELLNQNFNDPVDRILEVTGI
jgi:Rrf2 family protein